MIEHWLWLADRPRLGAIRAGELLARFGSAEAIYQTSDEALARAGVKPSVRAALADRSLAAAQKRFADCRAAGVRVLIPGDGEYPDRLRQQADAPVVLYAVGRMPDLENTPCIGLVGARDADGRGLELARRLGWQIAGCGGTVVTGMARGIDAMSALGALDRGGPVIGVLGCGVDVVYPKENAAVLARVAESGCLVSEYPPGAAPLARRFPARNRIISALSDGVVVVQAAENSGAMITARWAAEQGRDVFAVPGPAGDPRSRGCSELLRNGALLAECGWDVLREYEYRYPAAVREYHGRPPAAELPAPAERDRPVRPASVPEKQTPAERNPVPGVQSRDFSGLTEPQRRIVQTLLCGPMQLDALIDRAGLPAGQVLSQLTLLELRGVVRRDPGKFYALI